MPSDKWKLVSYSATPPYYSIFLFILDIFTNALPVVGLLFYSNKIAPPDLIATMAAVAGVFFWTIGMNLDDTKDRMNININQQPRHLT